jgi:DNA-binding MarR family transcriptional regulator
LRDTDVKKNSTQRRQELIGRLALAIRASQNASDAYDEHVAGALGINVTDLRCLDVLSQRGPLSAGQLAEAMHLSSGAVTTLVDRLERRGYARRTRDTEDRRRVLIELDRDAAGNADAYYVPMMEWTVRKLEDFTEEQIVLMIEFLEEGRQMVDRELAKLESRPSD